MKAYVMVLLAVFSLMSVSGCVHHHKPGGEGRASPQSVFSGRKTSLTVNIQSRTSARDGGMEADAAAICEAISSRWSNGVVEGHVNRLKMLKRQMYGRAGFELLRQRVMSPLA